MPIAALGLLWLCLWKGRLRLLGVPAALAVLLWPRPPAPVAWIASDGGAAAVAEHGQVILLRPDAKQFASDLWARRLERVDAQVVCVGHTHLPYVLEVGDKLVINPGSVGQPRDGDPRAAYAVIEDNRNRSPGIQMSEHSTGCPSSR